jgi:DNA-binding NtrC family response regulator
MALMLPVAHCPTPSWKSCGNGHSADNNSPEKGQDDSVRSSASDASNGKGRILVVDDDEPVRATLAELLEDEGFRSVQAGDAVEALAILRQSGAIDVLVTDLTMPGDDGIALIRQAREIRNGLPAILLTGYAEQATSVTTIAGGNFHVLRKPIDSDRLIEQLELLVAKPGV